MENFLNKIFKNREYRKPVIFNSTKSMRFETTPKFLFSYNEKILEIDDDRNITLYNKTANGGMYFSQTTSQQIGKVRNYLLENDIPFSIVDFH